MTLALTIGAGTAAAQTRTLRVDIRQPTLDAALSELAREAGVEILLEPSMVARLRAHPVVGQMTAATALTSLLQGSGLGYRVPEPDVFVLFRLPPARDPGSQDGAVAELLVVGRRTQNADIRRAENDVQHYRITSTRDLQASHPASLDAYLRNRQPANVSIRAPMQDTLRQPGRTTSEIDLRGLGAHRTLVLVDGRRLPSTPTGTIDFTQPDINAIPVGAVERIEVLTSTAGGIHGPGALGGVVNVIMRRDYRGADLRITGGVTDRSDAASGRVEGRIGFSPDGATDIMLLASATSSRPLLSGQRDYELRERQQRLQRDPAALLALAPTGNGVGVYSTQPLSLDSALGGASLGATYTYLPAGYPGSPTDRVAALVANAGTLVPGLSDDATGAQRYLTSRPATRSGLLTVRRRLGDHIEVFVDGLYLDNRGTLVAGGRPTSVLTPADSPGNPFEQPVTFSFPAPAFDIVARQVSTVSRFTTGIVAQIGPDWAASADFTVGRARLHTATNGFTVDYGPYAQALAGQPTPGKPALAPLDTGEFQASIQAYLLPQDLRSSLVNRYSAFAARAGGSGPRLAGGPLTFTVLGEHRREDAPVSQTRFRSGGDTLVFIQPPRRQTLTSAHLEVRAPLMSDETPLSFLRGAELQGAVRYDRIMLRFDDDPSDGVNAILGGKTQRNVTAFTLGGKVMPLSGLMLRASVATGELPPSIRDLISRTTTITAPQAGLADPSRGDRLLGSEGAVDMVSGGSRAIKGEQSRTLAIGIVVNPDPHRAPRLSIDYSQIDLNREVTRFPLSPAELLAFAGYPDRIERAGLTDADQAAGYTAGRVTRLDTTALETGRRRSASIDAQFDWRRSFETAGEVRIYGLATWQAELRRRNESGQPWQSYVGYADSLLPWRANAGVSWTKDPVSVDLNLQHVPRYRVSGAEASADETAFLVRNQGSTHVSSQTYLDVSTSWRIDSPTSAAFRSLELRLGVQNLLDSPPPLAMSLDQQPGYSPYGDPRRRRVEMQLFASF